LSRWARCGLALLLLWLAGCAQPPARAPASTPAWSGRLALLVQDTAEQSFHANFELSGNPEQGTLLLTSPLGTTVARLHWAAGMAELEQGGQRRSSAALDTLLQELTGSSLPIAALFDWLQGRATPATGWQVDVSAATQGRITAQRWQPLPQATLRIVLSP
jgi:outer membrane lipoprotein LolB